MKRPVSILLLFILLLSLSACAQNNSTEDTTAETKDRATPEIPIDSEFQSLEELAYLKLLLDNNDADALKMYTYRNNRLALTNSIPQLRSFFDYFGNIETVFPKLESGFSLNQIRLTRRQYEMEFEKYFGFLYIECLSCSYALNDYRITIEIFETDPSVHGISGFSNPSRDPDIKLFVDGKQLDLYEYEPARDTGGTYLKTYLKVENRVNRLYIVIPQGAEEPPLEEILTFTTLNELLEGVTPLDPTIDPTTESTSEPT